MAIRISDVMRALFADCRGAIEFRAFDAGGCCGRLFAQLEADLDQIRTFWQTHQAHNLYWGVSTRRDDRDGTLANCLDLPAVFADCDFKLSSEATVREQLAAFPLSPTLVIASGGGLQPYWFFREPADVPAEADRLRDLLRRLAAYLEADIVAGEPARILRVPGSVNIKYTPGRTVCVEAFAPERRYNPSDFDWLPAMPVRAASQSVDLSKVIGEFRNTKLYVLARTLKAKHLPDCMIATTITVLNAECCAPPLEDLEVTQILHNALTQPDRPCPQGRQPITIEVG